MNELACRRVGEQHLILPEADEARAVRGILHAPSFPLRDAEVLLPGCPVPRVEESALWWRESAITFRPAHGDERLSVRRDADAVEDALWSGVSAHRLAGFHVPHLRRSVPQNGREQRVVRGDGRRAVEVCELVVLDPNNRFVLPDCEHLDPGYLLDTRGIDEVSSIGGHGSRREVPIVVARHFGSGERLAPFPVAEIVHPEVSFCGQDVQPARVGRERHGGEVLSWAGPIVVAFLIGKSNLTDQDPSLSVPNLQWLAVGEAVEWLVNGDEEFAIRTECK